jgi:membrane fusion protein (multidrug efflux system)
MALPYAEERAPEGAGPRLDPAPLAGVRPAGSPALKLAAAAALLGALAWSGRLYWERGAYQSTDDAFVKGRIATLSPKVPGHLARLLVEDNQEVAEGQLLAELDPRDYEAALRRAKASLAVAEAKHAQARIDFDSTKVTAGADLDQATEGVKALEQQKSEESARLAGAQAEVDLALAQLRRREDMEKRRAVSREELDAARAAAAVASANAAAIRKRLVALDAQVAQAQAKARSARTAPLRIERSAVLADQYQAEIELARAEVAQAELNLSYTRVYAPEQGRIAKKSIEPGSYVQPGAALLALVADDLWVEANFKETQITGMRPGQPVELRIDAFPGERYQGRVESIQPGTGTQFSLLPAENATGNFVKTVQRVPVKIVFDPPPSNPRRLFPGLSVVPEVKIR